MSGDVGNCRQQRICSSGVNERICWFWQAVVFVGIAAVLQARIVVRFLRTASFIVRVSEFRVSRMCKQLNNS